MSEFQYGFPIGSKNQSAIPIPNTDFKRAKVVK
jgi:hypothetical protein